MIHFSSENFAGVHPSLMQALADANNGHMPSYGKDAITAATIDRFREVFGEQIEVYFTFNGTGANNFGLSCLARRYQSIFCTDIAHLYVDESTAPEMATGCRLYPVLSHQGKISLEALTACLNRTGDIHHPQPGVLSITQPTEYGMVYSLEELAAINVFCQANGLSLHMDGARLCQAAAYLNVRPGQICTVAGVDVLTLGGTKTGMLFGEAVIFWNLSSTSDRQYYLKRSMQLASKSRFIAAQFKALLGDQLWQDIAHHTNRLAQWFATELLKQTSLRIAYPVQTNMVFVVMPRRLHTNLQSHVSFYYWNEQRQEARFVFSFDNTLEEVSKTIAAIRNELITIR